MMAFDEKAPPAGAGLAEVFDLLELMDRDPLSGEPMLNEIRPYADRLADAIEWAENVTKPPTSVRATVVTAAAAAALLTHRGVGE